MNCSLSCLLLFFSCLAIAQFPQPEFQHFTVDDGLPSSEVYYVMQDSRGYIWFATDRGVSRFNGYEFENFTEEDGLSDNVVFQIIEDHQQRLWFVTFSCKLSYYQGDSIYSYPYNDALLQELKGNSIIRSFHVDEDETLHIGVKEKGYLTISKEGQLEHQYAALEKGVHFSRIEEQPFNFSVLKRELIGKKGTFHVHVPGFEGTYWLPTMLPAEYHSCTLPNNRMAVSMGNVLTAVDDTSEALHYRQNIVWLNTDGKDRLWAGFYKNGVRCYDANSLQLKYQLLKDYSVSCVYNDWEGGLWFTTLERGVYYLPSMSFHTYSTASGLPDADVYSIAGNGSNETILGFRKGMVSRIVDHKLENTYDLSESGRVELPVSTIHYRAAEDEYWIDNDGLYVLGKEGLSTLSLEHPITRFNAARLHASCILESKDGSIWLGTTTALIQTRDGHAIHNSNIDSITVRVSALYEDSGGRIWVGSLNGLYEYHNNKFVYHGDVHPLLSKRIVDIVGLADTMILGTRGAGLVVVAPDTIYNISEVDGLNSSIVNAIAKDGRQIVVGTNKGVNIVGIRGGRTSIRSFTKKHGLVSDEVNKVHAQNGEVWIATNHGVTQFVPQNISVNAYKPPVFIKLLKVNYQDTILPPGARLNYDQNLLQIEYIGLSYRSMGDITYRYQMEGVDSTWTYTKNTSIQFTTLPPGDYRFVVSAKNEDGVWSAMPAAISFTILPPFWKTWWFYLLIALFFIALVWVFFALRYRALKVRSQLIKQASDSEQKALSAQLTPHFIFNSLNSIQQLIAANQKREAVQHVAGFAKLMRKILRNSREKSITIEEEVETLRYYLELESLRFEGKFEYEVVIDEKIDVDDVTIPPMLIQPYVENAIWHGIMNKDERKGKVTITFALEKDMLICEVMDDGIGRKRAAELRSDYKEHKKSYGMEITMERLKLLNAQQKQTLLLDVVDLEDEKGNALGTLVKLYIRL